MSNRAARHRLAPSRGSSPQVEIFDGRTRQGFRPRSEFFRGVRRQQLKDVEMPRDLSRRRYDGLSGCELPLAQIGAAETACAEGGTRLFVLDSADSTA
jgi:hypothetical protein